MSGTGLLTYQAEEGQSRHGKVYDDWDGLGEILDFPSEASHRKVDRIVLEAAKTAQTAIVCPPVIYGQGRGPVNKRAMISPLTASSFIRKGHGYVPHGTAAWHHVHVHDLTDLFVLLIDSAVEGGGKATWSKDGYYFAE